MRLKQIGVAMLIASGTVSAQQLVDPTVNLNVEARFDYQYDNIDGNAIDENSGFKGKYLNLQLSGHLNKYLTYSWRQRLNKSAYDGSFFDATDWVNLTYSPNETWSFSGGKEVVAIGGYEYDRAPINVFRGSEFWNNIPCYQFGVSSTYAITGGKDKIMAQICTNPFHKVIDNSNTYAYNLMWMGNHGVFNTLYSVNLIEYTPGHYINYIALGHLFDFKRVTLELDLMNRASSHQTFLFRDASVMANLGVKVAEPVTIYAKGTYDVNHTDSYSDFTVLPGTEIKMAGAGVEYHPFKIKNQDVRLHAYYFYSWGKNGNPDGALANKNSFVEVGLTWTMNILKSK
jgi:hypothetical protein